MEVEIEPELGSDAELKSTIDRATEILKDILGPSGDRARVVWALSRHDADRDLIDLRLSDWTGSVGYRFAPEELWDPSHMRLRLHRLWGDLLQVRSHVQLDGSRWSRLAHGER